MLGLKDADIQCFDKLLLILQVFNVKYIWFSCIS